MKIGLIGTGNMGGILAEAIADGQGIYPSNLYVTNRTLSKAEELKRKIPQIHVCQTASEVITNTDLIFLCMKPLDLFPILNDNQALFTDDKCVVSITSPISVEQLETIAGCSCVRAIPSITNRALAGVSLVTYGKSCTDEWRKKVDELLSTFSSPVEIDNSITRVASDIVSCGPAFFSYLTQRFIEAAVSNTGIDHDTATILSANMLIGLGELLRKEFYTLPALQQKVCVKGGITGEGIKVMEQELGDVFDHLFEATHEKFREDLEAVKKQFN
ncbi:late competence protein ComER [Heyndrickxia acidicola]|uniref:Late competence protein ComER n=1 Tax=Heyndrickxia acidicola TaxID=209389 RepID=A0ABU6MPU8_9BACI|nr:late competence protein ComER [Heyndrickxia acidicola]MED1205065.1 late competence protein ComER [Heyndrickxia acidicola]